MKLPLRWPNVRENLIRCPMWCLSIGENMMQYYLYLPCILEKCLELFHKKYIMTLCMLVPHCMQLAPFLLYFGPAPQTATVHPYIMCT